MLTYSQYFLYLKAAGKEQLKEFKEQAMAARLGMASKEGWEDFMRIIDGEKIRTAEAEFIEGLLDKKPTPGMQNDSIAFEGFIPAEE